jgi:hypothetical protein
MGLWSEPIGYTTIGWEYEPDALIKFEATIPPGDLRARGKMIQVHVGGSWTTQDFALSWCTIWTLPLWDTDIGDKL